MRRLPQLFATSLSFISAATADARAQDPLVTLDDATLVSDVPGPTEFGQGLDLDGSLLAIGAPEAPGGGVVRTMRRLANGWVHEDQFACEGCPAPGRFGWSVALAEPWLVVGAPASAGGGLAAVFEDLDGDGQYQLAQIIQLAVGDFGWSVDTDGERLIIGSYTHHSAVDVWKLVGTTWEREVTLSTPTPAVQDHFGYSVAIEGDLAVVGTIDSDLAGPDQGAVHAYSWSGTDWELVQTILPPIPPSSPVRSFGFDLELAGGRLAVGDPYGGGGAIRIYEWGAGTWNPADVILNADPPFLWNQFGHSFDFDGELVAVREYGPSPSEIQVFQEWPDGWRRIAELSANGVDETYLTVPAHLAVDGEGGVLAVGGPHWNSDTGKVVTWKFRAAVKSFCSGDGTAAPCPCSNPGGASEGCANSTGDGAFLIVGGSNSLEHDDLELAAERMPASQPVLLFAGTLQVAHGAGLPFGDGLRCAGGEVVRLGVEVSDALGKAKWPWVPAILGGWSAGEKRSFQVWYRDPVGGPCGATFNTSQGVQLTFIP